MARARGSTPSPRRSTRDDVAGSSTRLAAQRHRRGGRLDVVPPERAAARRCCCGWPASAAIAAISEDYPGSLLDVRHRADRTAPRGAEPGARRSPPPPGYAPAGRRRRPAALAADAGCRTPSGDGRTSSCIRGRQRPRARWPLGRRREVVAELRAPADGASCVTGGPGEARADRAVVPRGARRASTSAAARLPALAEVLARADAVVVGNTGPAHLAAAVGTPVVSLFAPVVPAVRWRPWRVPARAARRPVARRAGRPGAGSARSRAIHASRRAAAEVVDAVGGSRRAPANRTGGGRMNILIWHVHGSWTTAFVQGNHEYLVPVTARSRPRRPGAGPHLGLARRVREVPPGELADDDVDVVVLQRPHEAGAAPMAGGRRPAGTCPPSISSTTRRRGDVAEPRAIRWPIGATCRRARHAFQRLFWDTGDARTAGHRARRGRPGDR